MHCPLGWNIEHDPRAAFFNDLAHRWDVVGQDPTATVQRLTEFKDLLGLTSGMDLLEVGCGTGQITGWLASQVAPGRVVAIDFAEKMIEQANRKNVPAEFRHADVCRADLGERCFDVVLCFHSFPHFRDQSAALKNLTWAMRKTGRLLVKPLGGSRQINAFHDETGGPVAGDHLPVDGQWEPLLAKVGLRIEEHHDRDGFFFLSAKLA
jgi:ubiquinone/menaquinone biosynthesis C-methylase UbiE